MIFRKPHILFVLIFSIYLISCARRELPVPVPVSELETTVVVTATPAPTATIEITKTAVPTTTSSPTSTPEVAKTSLPTVAPSSTATPEITKTAIPTPTPNTTPFYLDNTDPNPIRWQSATLTDLGITFQLPDTWSANPLSRDGFDKLRIKSDVSLREGNESHWLEYFGWGGVYENPEQKSLQEFYAELYPDMLSWFEAENVNLKIDNHLALRCVCFPSYKGAITYLIADEETIFIIGFGPFRFDDPFPHQAEQIQLFDTLVQSITFDE